MGKKQSILFLENNLDLRHLRHPLNNYDYQTEFAKTEEEFFSMSSEEKYDLLILSAKDKNDKGASILDFVGETQNSSTPVLMVLDNNIIPDPEESFPSDINIITFPFSPNEVVFRIRQILRNHDREASIESTLSEFRDLLNTTPIGIVQTDSHGGLIRFNKRFTDLMKMEDSRLRKENFFQLCHPDDYFLERKQLDRLLKKEITRIRYEVRLINDEGKTIVCDITAGVKWSEKDHFNYFSFTVEEIL